MDSTDEVNCCDYPLDAGWEHQLGSFAPFAAVVLFKEHNAPDRKSVVPHARRRRLMAQERQAGADLTAMIVRVIERLRQPEVYRGTAHAAFQATRIELSIEDKPRE